jgi:sugar phosphate isomerase/epimerase
MKRRTFIESSVAATIVSAASHPLWAKTAAAAPAHHIQPIGLQLYTVRDLMKKDFDGTIAGVAKIGYKEVEFAGYDGKTPKEVRAVIDHNGLTAPSAHIPMAQIENKMPETLEAANIVGHKYIVCPWFEVKDRTPDGYKKAAETFSKAGEACQKAGIQFAYHNHGFEFEKTEGLGGKLPLDYLLTETDPKLVKVELDLCWITVAGQDPVAYFNKYPGRFPLVHVKDWSKEGTAPKGYDVAVGHPVAEGHIANVGQGSIDFKRIFAQAEKAGIKHYFVENDEAKGLEDTAISYNYLSKLEA